MNVLAFGFSNIGNILLVAVGLGTVIFIHELGHFMVAKWCDVKVERFSIGFGPIIWKVTRGETEYALSAIPFGGYVKMLGQDDADPEPDDRRPRRQRSAFVHGQNRAAANRHHLGGRDQQHGLGGAVFRDRLHARREVSARRRGGDPRNAGLGGRTAAGRQNHARQQPLRQGIELHRRAARGRLVEEGRTSRDHGSPRRQVVYDVGQTGCSGRPVGPYDIRRARTGIDAARSQRGKRRVQPDEPRSVGLAGHPPFQPGDEIKTLDDVELQNYSDLAKNCRPAAPKRWNSAFAARGRPPTRPWPRSRSSRIIFGHWGYGWRSARSRRSSAARRPRGNSRPAIRSRRYWPPRRKPSASSSTPCSCPTISRGWQARKCASK